MKTQLYQIIVWIHVLAGFVALLTGTLILFAKKGNSFHRLAGQLYYYGMAGVFVTTLTMLAIYPDRQNLWFFSIVAIVSFYQTLTGRWAVNDKKGKEKKPVLIEWMALGWVLVSGILALGLGFWNGLNGQIFFGVIYLFFAMLGLSTGYQDYLVYSHRRPKVHWFFHHIARMMGSFAATTTAFIVNIGPRFLPENLPMLVFIFLWVFPGILIGYLSSRWIRRQKNRIARQPA